MDGDPRSLLRGFKPQCDDIDQVVGGLFRGLLSTVHLY